MFFKLFLIAMTTVVVAVNAWSSTDTSSTWSPTSIPTSDSSTLISYTTTTSSAPILTPSLTPCIIGCSSAAAAQDGCVSYTNVTCVCTNPQFQADAGYCIEQDCTPAEFQAALALQSAECAAVSLTPTGPSATPSSIPYTYSSTVSSSIYASSSLPSGVYTSGGSTYYSSTTTSPTSSASSSATSTAAAYSLAPNGGVAAIVAMVFGFLAI